MEKFKAFLEFLKEWDTVLLFVGLPLLIVPLEVLTHLIKTKNKKNPLYWIDRFLTVFIRVFYKRFTKS